MICRPQELSLTALYADRARVGQWWNYRNVSSPFYRLYLVTAGRGRVVVGTDEYGLQPGDLFLIPKFALHSYGCDDFMEHCYVCFFDETAFDSGIANPAGLRLHLESRPVDAALVERFLELNPYMPLPVADPRKYDNDKSLYVGRRATGRMSFAEYVESRGILLQLFSRFITPESLRADGGGESSRIGAAIRYVNEHIGERLAVSELSETVCVTPGHLSKLFKGMVGMSPNEYIRLKKMERAQVLLLTSDMSVGEVAEMVGVGNLSQFSRMFSRVTGCSAREYRMRQLSSLTGSARDYAGL